jgi:hypothetical protein
VTVVLWASVNAGFDNWKGDGMTRPVAIRAVPRAVALGFAVLYGAPALAAGPVALVETIERAPPAQVSFLDYVYPGQVIDLGADGMLVLSYFMSCTIETVRGGVVTVQPGASKVSGGSVSTREVPCQGAKIYVVTATSEAGATVSRLDTKGKSGPPEWTTTSQRPTFIWPAASSTGTLTVIDLDLSPPKIVWQRPVSGGKLVYPTDVPDLEVGFPYEVTVSGTGTDARAIFTIDPYLDMGNSAVSRVVPLR